MVLLDDKEFNVRGMRERRGLTYCEALFEVLWFISKDSTGVPSSYDLS